MSEKQFSDEEEEAILEAVSHLEACAAEETEDKVQKKAYQTIADKIAKWRKP